LRKPVSIDPQWVRQEAEIGARRMRHGLNHANFAHETVIERLRNVEHGSYR
jgi:hypothetical protein